MEDFRQIWLPLSGRFYRVAFHLLENEADAEDAVQELYLKLWDSRDRLTDVRNPSAYGITLLRNICIDRIRRMTRSHIAPLETDVPLDDPPPDRAASEKDTLKRLLEEIGRLPEKQGKVLRMRVLEELEYEEVSRRTGLSEVHIRVLVSTARKTLRKRLGL